MSYARNHRKKLRAADPEGCAHTAALNRYYRKTKGKGATLRSLWGNAKNITTTRSETSR